MASESSTPGTVIVGVIEWASDDGREPAVIAATDRERVEHALAVFLAAEYADSPQSFYDDSVAFMDNPRVWLDDPERPVYGPLTAADWLAGLHTASTAPWASILETPVQGG